MNTSHHHARLDHLAAVIDELRARVLHAERNAFELFDSELQSSIASTAVTEIKMRLDSAYIEYVTISEFVRRAERTRKSAA